MTLRNPCRDCKFLNADKNNHACVRCENRIAYLRAIEGDSRTGLPAVVIDGPTIKEAKRSQFRRPAPPEMGPKVRDILIDCCREHGIRLVDLTNGRRGGLVPSAVVEARREAVVRLLAAGVAVEQIADATGLGRATVYLHAKTAKVKVRGKTSLSKAIDALLAETCAAYDLPREMLTMRSAHSGRVQSARCHLVGVLRNPPYALGLERIADVLGMSRPTARRYAAMADAAAPPRPPAKKPDEVVAEICSEQGIGVDELAAPKAVRARVLVTARLRQAPYRMSLAEVGAYFGMGIKAVANYTAMAKDEGLLPAEQIYTGRRKARQAARA